MHETDDNDCPAPALRDVGSLAEELPDAGLPVEVRVIGTRHHRLAALEMTAYHLTQGALVRHGLTVLLRSESNIDVVGEAETGEGALRLIHREHPDVLLKNIRMPGPDQFTERELEVLRSLARGLRADLGTPVHQQRGPGQSRGRHGRAR